ncbi:hypothetical protein J6590_039075 [Homalodisca vitripennis]|nr:hypothetical protein J6590_039075 [Homalodisca vitripennis]
MRSLTSFAISHRNKSVVDFQEKLDIMDYVLCPLGVNLIVAGDFNTKTVEWGMQVLDGRGRRILEMTARRWRGCGLFSGWSLHNRSGGAGFGRLRDDSACKPPHALVGCADYAGRAKCVELR